MNNSFLSIIELNKKIIVKKLKNSNLLIKNMKEFSCDAQRQFTEKTHEASASLETFKGIPRYLKMGSTFLILLKKCYTSSLSQNSTVLLLFSKVVDVTRALRTHYPCFTS